MPTFCTVHRRSGNANTPTPRAKWAKQRSYASAPNDETRYDQECSKSRVTLAADVFTRGVRLVEQKRALQGCFVWIRKGTLQALGSSRYGISRAFRNMDRSIV